MRKNPWITLLVLIGFFALVIYYVIHKSPWANEDHLQVKKNNILVLPVEGVILDSTKFVKQIRKYKKEDSIKALVVKVNSPGGVVGPSQEIYEAIKNFKQETRKPVIVSSSSLNASGAYYLSVAADKIVVNQGTLMGSIGVIMEFANLERLYDWAKVNRFSITSGKFKDSGAEYRTMRDDEKKLFQDLIDEVYGQFKNAVKTDRKLSNEVIEQYADGRVFTGEFGVKMGFADKVGTFEEAIKLASELAGIGNDYEIYEPPKAKPKFIDLFVDRDDEDEGWESIFKRVTKTKLMGKPLFLMPGVWE